MTKGLPASGKSTWAKELIDKEPGKWKRVNKDDLRAMLDNSKWSEKNEKFILTIRDYTIQAAATNGYNIIVDDTNFAPKHEKDLRYFAKLNHLEFEIKDFTNVPLDVCIERDMKRQASVGKKVIMQMYNQYLKPNIKPIEYNPDLPNAVICDLDGTLALFNDNPYERDFSKDKLNKAVAEVIKHTSAITLITSGRNSKFREETEVWLKENGIKYGEMFMRAEDDSRKDSIVKQEIYEANIKGKYNVLFVLDDRNQVVDFWRSQGLTCLQVADGNF